MSIPTRRPHAPTHRSAKTNRFPPCRPETAPKNERFVKIVITFEDVEGCVHSHYPLSLLQTYSQRARSDLPQLGEDQGPLTWKLTATSTMHETSSYGLSVVLRWLLTLPQDGFSSHYNGHPQLIINEAQPFDTDKLVRIANALKLLEIAAPLDQQVVIPNMIKTNFCAGQDFTAAEVELVFATLLNNYPGAVNHVVHRAVDFFDDYASDEERQVMNELRKVNDGLDRAMADVEEKKAKRVKREEKNRKTEEWRERQATREARKEAHGKRVKHVKQKAEDASLGMRFLSEAEAAALMGRFT